jgi:hypothetical protein
MNLLSLLIAPLQVVVLFFAPHAAIFPPHAVMAKPANTRLPSRWFNSDSSAACTNAAPSRALWSTARSAHAVSPLPLHAACTQRLRAASITYPQAVAQVTAKPIHRVRVVRNLDAALPADRAGRMVVSGRFADVCAELDRLAAMDLRATA